MNHPYHGHRDATCTPSTAFAAAPGAGSADGGWMEAVLDELDLALLLVAEDGQVLHLNHAARMQLDAGHPLQCMGGGLRARHGPDIVPLFAALSAACQRGLRTMVTLGSGEQASTVSVVPLASRAGQAADGNHAPMLQRALLLLGRSRLCAELALHHFARDAQLTPTEGLVLKLLTEGVRPSEIAQRQRVGLTTVRTHIEAIRGKTGVHSTLALIRRLALLPPLLGVLRQQPGAAGRS